MAVKKRSYDVWPSYVDMLMNVLMFIALLFILSIIMVNPKKNQDGVALKAEYIISLDWPADTNADVDLWLMLPDGQMVSYASREVNLTHLDRDSRGWLNNAYTDPKTGEIIKSKSVKEIITFRGCQPGEYKVAGHLYAKFDGDAYVTNKQIQPGEPTKVSATLDIDKLNPTVETKFHKEITFTDGFQEIPIVSFELKSDCSITNIEKLDPSDPDNSIITQWYRKKAGK